MEKQALFDLMRGTVIVSCQAVPGEPLYLENGTVMPLMARAAKMAGAKMIRTSSARDIEAIKKETGLPVIGLIKRRYPGYQSYITATLREVEECVSAGSDIVSVDCTFGPRGDGLTPGQFLCRIREKYPDIILMADCATFEEGLAAHAAGADLVGTTMNGYTPDTLADAHGPNLALVRRLADALPCPVLAEGRIHTPEQARQALQAGAWAAVVGGAITRPMEIAQRFMDAVKDVNA